MLSVVVVAYDMIRELPRTLFTLGTSYQRDIEADDYEVIVVDNGSPEPLPDRLAKTFAGHLRMERLDPASPSPTRAWKAWPTVTSRFATATTAPNKPSTSDCR